MDMVAGRVWAAERRPIRHVDVALLVVVAILVSVGFFLLYSATNQTLRQDGLDPFARVSKQAITAVIGMALLLFVATFDYRFLKVYAGFTYAALLFALVLVRIPGLGATDPTGTARRWFEIAGFQITPSEFIKLGVIVMLATLMSELRAAVPTTSDVARLLGVAIVPLVLEAAGAAFLHEPAARDAESRGAVVTPVTPRLSRPVGLVHAGRPLSPAAARFVEIARA